jgi:hypothetical protein
VSRPLDVFRGPATAPIAVGTTVAGGTVGVGFAVTGSDRDCRIGIAADDAVNELVPEEDSEEVASGVVDGPFSSTVPDEPSDALPFFGTIELDPFPDFESG